MRIWYKTPWTWTVVKCCMIYWLLQPQSCTMMGIWATRCSVCHMCQTAKTRRLWSTQEPLLLLITPGKSRKVRGISPVSSPYRTSPVVSHSVGFCFHKQELRCLPQAMQRCVYLHILVTGGLGNKQHPDGSQLFQTDIIHRCGTCLVLTAVFFT